MLAGVAALALYAVGCSVMHGLLQRHYLDACTGYFFWVGASPYCSFVRRGLDVLQAAPLAPLLLSPPLRRLVAGANDGGRP